MFHFHNREHKIGMCALLLGLTGNMQFVPLCHCTQTGINIENQNNWDFNSSANNINMKNYASNLHNTSSDSSSSLSEKLSGVLDPEEISKLIKEHAEQMTRPSPPVPKTEPLFQVPQPHHFYSTWYKMEK